MILRKAICTEETFFAMCVYIHIRVFVMSMLLYAKHCISFFILIDPERENDTFKVNEPVDDYKGEDAHTKPCRIITNTTNSGFPKIIGPTNNVTELTRYKLTHYLLHFNSREKHRMQ